MEPRLGDDSRVTAEMVYELLSEQGRMGLPELAEHFEVEPETVRQRLRDLSERHRIVWGSDFEYRAVEK